MKKKTNKNVILALKINFNNKQFESIRFIYKKMFYKPSTNKNIEKTLKIYIWKPQIFEENK